MSHILTDLRDRIATITLNRPEKLNAFAGTMREDLLQILRNLAADSECRMVVITGAGRAFCAGGDVEFMYTLQQRGDMDAFRKLLSAGGAVVSQIVEMPKVSMIVGQENSVLANCVNQVNRVFLACHGNVYWQLNIMAFANQQGF